MKNWEKLENWLGKLGKTGTPIKWKTGTPIKLLFLLGAIQGPPLEKNGWRTMGENNGENNGCPELLQFKAAGPEEKKGMFVKGIKQNPTYLAEMLMQKRWSVVFCG